MTAHIMTVRLRVGADANDFLPQSVEQFIVKERCHALIQHARQGALCYESCISGLMTSTLLIALDDMVASLIAYILIIP